MLAVKNGELGKKLFLYSAHDVTVVAVLKALGVYFPHVPKFSSATILELHQINGDYFIKVFTFLLLRNFFYIYHLDIRDIYTHH